MLDPFELKMVLMASTWSFIFFHLIIRFSVLFSSVVISFHFNCHFKIDEQMDISIKQKRILRAVKVSALYVASCNSMNSIKLSWALFSLKILFCSSVVTTVVIISYWRANVPVKNWNVVSKSKPNLDSVLLCNEIGANHQRNPANQTQTKQNHILVPVWTMEK